MKGILTGILFIIGISATAQVPASSVSPNLVIVTLDGFRWQEIFFGADPRLLANTTYTADTATMISLYHAADTAERRKRLLPFFWNVLVKRGQLYGNRLFDNKVNVANPYHISYPGYHEIFTGNSDLLVNSNKRKNNRHINLLEHLHQQPGFQDKVAAFTSWDVFPYIFNKDRNNLQLNSGYLLTEDDNADFGEALLKKVEQESVYDKKATRHDLLTFLTAKEHLARYRPKVLFIGLGETDEAAHAQRYDLYLEKASQADRMLAELWHWIQSTPGYKDNTVLLITTDHGRGNSTSNWNHHGFFVKGSSQTWMAVIGAGISPLGEIKEPQQWHQKQLAQTMAGLLGEKFLPVGQPVAAAIPLK